MSFVSQLIKLSYLVTNLIQCSLDLLLVTIIVTLLPLKILEVNMHF